MSLYPGAVPVEDVHRWKTEATQRLLGYTIAFTEDEWHQPARLPGWTRAHVATHLARNADYLGAVLSAIHDGQPQPAPPSSARQRAELEVGADRSGLALQIDLDAAAGALQGAIDLVTDWSAPVVLNGVELPLSALPLARLHEITVHLIDLDCAFPLDSIPAESTEWLLRWALFRLQGASLPAMTLSTDTTTASLGNGTDLPLKIHGSNLEVWAWLVGRLGPETVTGADGLILPLLG